MSMKPHQGDFMTRGYHTTQLDSPRPAFGPEDQVVTSALMASPHSGTIFSRLPKEIRDRTGVVASGISRVGPIG